MPDPISDADLAELRRWAKSDVAHIYSWGEQAAALLARLDAAEAEAKRPRTRHLTPDALAAIEAVSDERPAYVDGVGFVEWSDVDRDLEMFTQAQLEERVLRAEAERDRLAAVTDRFGRAILTYVDLLRLERIPDAEVECPEMQAQNELVDIAATLAPQEADHA